MLSLKDGSVKNVVGGDNLQPDNLFAYGDVDGKGAVAKLQHPLDVKFTKIGDEDLLVVADSYNHALKIINLKTKNCQRIKMDRYTQLNEPNSVFIGEDNRIWIADTNNHGIKCIDWPQASTENEFDVDIFKIEFANECFGTNKLVVEDSYLKGNIQLKLDDIDINFDAPNDWKLIIETVKSGRFEYSGVIDQSRKNCDKMGVFNLVSTDLQIDAIEAIELELNIIHCEKSSGVCKMLKNKMLFNKAQLESMSNSSRELILLKLS